MDIAVPLIVFVTLLVDFNAWLIGFGVELMDFTAPLMDFAAFPVRDVLRLVGKWTILIAHCPTSGRKRAFLTGKMAIATGWHGRCVGVRMAQYKISMAFAKLTDGELAPFAGNTIKKMTDNPGYLEPRVPLSEMWEAKNTFFIDYAASQGGGRLATATKNASRRKLINLLRQQAAYVQSIAGGALALLLSSGFLAASTNRARMVLPRAVIKSVKWLQSTKLIVAVEPVKSARGYEARYKTENGEYIPAPFSTSSRGLLLENLVPGVLYTIQARAVGGLNGYGDWSDPVSRIAV
jgi:hypothetical protein